MDYATEWKPLPLERRNTLCAGAMGWRHETRNDYTVWLDRDGKELSSVSSYSETPWAPCTDRNHTAMMVEEVSANAHLVTLFNKHLSDVTDHWPLGPLFVLGIEPDKIAWAAWSALTQKEET